MALLFVDGFDHIGTSTTDIVTFGKWGTAVGSSFGVYTTIVRTGTCSARPFNTSAGIITKAYTTNGGVVVGGAFYYTSTITATDILKVLEIAAVHVAIGITTGGLLTVKRGTTVLATGTTILAANTWNYIELKAVIHDTTGSYELRINGITELTATNVDTRDAAGATGIWDRIQISGTGAQTSYWDDFYLCDTSGVAPNNTFLGMIKIETLLPQTDAVSAGSNAGLTPSTGTDHGALVDENPPNTTDYNGSATVGAKDTYQFPSMALTGTIIGIQTNLYAQKTDTTARTVCAVVRAGSTDYDGATISPTTTFQYQTEVRPLNPNTGVAWTATDIANLQAGMKVVS